MSVFQISQIVSMALGALYVLSIVLNLFNPLLALRWPRFAAVLSTMGGHIADARQELGMIRMARRITAATGAALLAFLLVSCSAAPVITSVAEVTCIAVTDAEFPAAEPLCVLGDELAIAIETYIAQHGGTAPAVQTTAKATKVPHDLFDALAQRPGIKARKAKAPVCKPAQGQVAP